MKIAVSFLKSIFDNKTTIRKIDESISDYIHVDIMDGKFVKNKNFTNSEIIKLLGNTKKPLDVHLMVKSPNKYLETFATLNTEYLTFHYEAVDNVQNFINEVSSYGFKVGLSLKPKTSIKKIKEFLPYLDQVLVMSVVPGAGGQEFILSSIDKVNELVKLREENNYNYIINIDGGINEESINFIKETECDMIVSGSYICSEEDFNNKINSLIN